MTTSSLERHGGNRPWRGVVLTFITFITVLTYEALAYPLESIPGPDLVVTRVAGPSVAYAGAAIEITNIVRNIGLANVRPDAQLRLGFYLSTDTTFTTNDFFVGSRTLDGLAAGAATSEVSSRVIGPNMPAGIYYLGAIVDDRNLVAEVNEDNNAFDGELIEIRPGPDYVVTALTAPSVGATTTSILLTSTIHNIGVGFLESTVGFYLSAQPAVTTNDLKLGSRLVGAINVSATVTIPVSVTPGFYYLAAIVDETNGVREVSESNNTSAAVPIQIVAGPDLIVENVSGPSSSSPAGYASYTDTVRNVGSWNVSSPFLLGYYLSTDPIITTSDLHLGERVINGLNAGESNSVNALRLIPPSIPLGTYYLGAIVDVNGQVVETDETNNTLATHLIEIVPGVDLIITALQGPATGVSANPITITDTVTNTEVALAFEFPVGFYLSADSVITTNDILLGRRIVVIIGGREANAGSSSIIIPATVPAGIYYLGGVVDGRNKIPETVETNNSLTAGTISITVGADIEAIAVSSPDVADGPAPVNVTNTVRNSGGQPIDSLAVGIYLSADAIIATNDIRIGSRTINNLLVGQTDTAVTLVDIGSTVAPGIYYIGVFADDASTLTELSVTNNALAGNTIQVVSREELVITSLTGPPRAATAKFLSVTNILHNAGTRPTSRPFNLRVVLSTDATITDSDITLGEFVVTNSIAAGQSLTVTGACFVRYLRPGPYLLGSIVDVTGQIAEVVETNNTFIGEQLEVLGPDIIVAALSIPTSATSGGSISVGSTVANIDEGFADGFNVSFYLSTDPVITTNDLFIGQAYVFTLAAGHSNSASTALSISPNLVSGTYHFGAIANSPRLILEATELNNTRDGGTITITAGPDLEISSLSVPAVAPTVGSIAITNAVRNRGSSQSGPFAVGFYLSPDATITTSDVKLGTRAVGNLAAGSIDAAVATLPVPAGLLPGTYHVGAIADDSGGLPESNEENNGLASTISIVLGVDLVVTAVSSPAAVIMGESVLVTNTVQNVGMFDLTTSVHIGLYLSVDATITEADVMVGGRTLPGGLAAGASSTASTAVSMLTVLPGIYHFGAIVDDEDAAVEVNESNNSFNAGALTVNGIMISSVYRENADLVVGFLTSLGKTYRLERTASLSDGTQWQAVSGAASIAGTGGTVLARDPGAVAQFAGFYRVRMTE